MERSGRKKNEGDVNSLPVNPNSHAILLLTVTKRNRFIRNRSMQFKDIFLVTPKEAFLGSG